MENTGKEQIPIAKAAEKIGTYSLIHLSNGVRGCKMARGRTCAESQWLCRIGLKK